MSHPVPLVVCAYAVRALGWIWVALMATAAVTSLQMPARMRLHWFNRFTLSPGSLLGDVAWKDRRIC